jgi:hypothetical protein
MARYRVAIAGFVTVEAVDSDAAIEAAWDALPEFTERNHGVFDLAPYRRLMEGNVVYPAVNEIEVEED